MPGIDFAEARAGIALAEVLDLLGFVACSSRDADVVVSHLNGIVRPSMQ